MAGVNSTTGVDALLSGAGTPISKQQDQKVSGSSVSAGVDKLVQLGKGTDSLFARGEAAATNLQTATQKQIEADAQQAEVTQAYVKSTLNASKIDDGLLQRQAARNAQLDEVIGKANQELIDANAEMYGNGDSGFLDHLVGLFRASRARATLTDLTTVQASENQQTQNTRNVMASLSEGIKMKAAETSQAQRDTAKEVALQTAEFNGYQNTAKVKSDQIQINTQILNQQMSAVELSNAQARLAGTNYELAKMKNNDAFKAQTVSAFNQQMGTNYSPQSYDALPDQFKVMMVQIAGGAMPVMKTSDKVTALNAMGVSNAKIEEMFPGTGQQLSIYQQAENDVDTSNLQTGMKPTADQRESQIADAVRNRSVQADNTLLSLATADENSTTWKNVPAETRAKVQPIMQNSMIDLQKQNISSQFNTLANALAKAEPSMTAKQLATTLQPIFDSLQSNMTHTLQSQGISNAGYNIPVETRERGMFGDKVKSITLSRPADMLSYAATIINYNQANTIRQGMLGSDSAKASGFGGDNLRGYADAYRGAQQRRDTSVYEKAMQQNRANQTKLDTTK